MRAAWAALLATAVVALDQATKAWIVATLPYGAEREVIPGLFNLVHARNRGIAFGLLGSSGVGAQVALLVVIVAIVVLVAVQLVRGQQGPLATAGLALVLGGAIGNLLDRLLRGEVVDFLDVFVRAGGAERHWPSFNVADSAITVGAICILIAEMFRPKERERAPDPR